MNAVQGGMNILTQSSMTCENTERVSLELSKVSMSYLTKGVSISPARRALKLHIFEGQPLSTHTPYTLTRSALYASLALSGLQSKVIRKCEQRTTDPQPRLNSISSSDLYRVACTCSSAPKMRPVNKSSVVSRAP